MTRYKICARMNNGDLLDISEERRIDDANFRLMEEANDVVNGSFRGVRTLMIEVWDTPDGRCSCYGARMLREPRIVYLSGRKIIFDRCDEVCEQYRMDENGKWIGVLK